MRPRQHARGKRRPHPFDGAPRAGVNADDPFRQRRIDGAVRGRAGAGRLGEGTKRGAAAASVGHRRRQGDDQRPGRERSGAGVKDSSAARLQRARDEIGHRNHERQRVPHGRRLLEQQMEDRVRHERDQEQAQRARRPPRQPHEADRRNRHDDAAGDGMRPRPEKRAEGRVEHRARGVHAPQHHHTGEIFTGLGPEGSGVRVKAAAGGNHRDGPDEGADDRRAERRDPILQAQSELRHHEREAEQGRGQEERLRANADRQSRHERAEDQRARGASPRDRRNDERLRRHGRGQTVMSLSGRSAVNQKSGAHAVTTVAHRARHSPASRAWPKPRPQPQAGCRLRDRV